MTPDLSETFDKKCLKHYLQVDVNMANTPNGKLPTAIRPESGEGDDDEGDNDHT